MHRNVIYRDGGQLARQVEPYTTTPPLGSPNPRDLWKWLDAYEEKTGGDVLAIAHNGNLANGIMFPEAAQYDGKKLDRDYVQQRIKWEPLYEVTQMKGDGETHPFLSPDDEFADYETWDKANLNMSKLKEDSMLAGEYAREALKRGLSLEEKLGTNPYKFGLIGSTDTHTSLATAQEDNFFGKHSGSEPGPMRVEHVVIQMGERKIMGWEQTASGLAAVWAKENTRESIFDAMERKETFATTGARMLVRFFGGWNFSDEDAMSRSPAFAGYEKGVPMGGDLTEAPDGGAPSFLVAALKDPLSGNLDRIQIVKGWMDDKGNLHERIYDVAVSDEREIDADGRCRTPVGNTVDVERATWTNTIGDSRSSRLKQAAKQLKVAELLLKPVKMDELRASARRLLHFSSTVRENSAEAFSSTMDHELRELFSTELASRLPLLDRYISQSDWKPAADILHQLIASSAMCREKELEDYSRLLYRVIQEVPSPKDIAQAYHPFLQAASRTKMQL